jgi:hypothetical protein
MWISPSTRVINLPMRMAMVPERNSDICNGRRVLLRVMTSYLAFATNPIVAFAATHPIVTVPQQEYNTSFLPLPLQYTGEFNSSSCHCPFTDGEDEVTEADIRQILQSNIRHGSD